MLANKRFLSILLLLIFFMVLSVSAERWEDTMTASGSGFIVSSNGYILTSETPPGRAWGFRAEKFL